METFVIRAWVPAEPEGDGRPTRLRGVVERVRSADRLAFENEAELLAFLHAALERARAEPQGGAHVTSDTA